MGSNEDLYELWMLYTSKNDVEYFKDYLRAFVKCYENLIDKDYIQLNEGFNCEGPHMTKLPDGLLESLSWQIESCVETCTIIADNETISYVETLTKALIIICRNLDNIALVASCEFVVHLVTLASGVIKQLCSSEIPDSTCFLSFLHHALHFLECIYDPYFVWSRRVHGMTIDKKKLKYKPALIHVEVVPFFYECFQQGQSCLEVSIQARLMHLFGAVISGSHVNSLKAICPATLHVLLTILSCLDAPVDNNCIRGEGVNIRDVVLKCLVRMIHVLHCATPDHRQVEVSSVIEGFLNVLYKMYPQNEADESYHLQLKTLGTIAEMLNCRDKVTLQAAFAGLNCFSTFVLILQKTNLTGVSAQNLAVTVVKAMTAIMTGSAVAKDTFIEKVGYAKLNEALKSLGQPNQELLAALLDLVFESNSTNPKNNLVHNPQAAAMLVQWLPDIQSHDLQIWLTENLLWLCSHNIYSRMQCCNECIISSILSIMHREKQINQKALGNLISLMEKLGTHSITAAEFKQLVSLLKPDEDKQQTVYTARLMHAMSVMASRSEKDNVLHYFNMQDNNAGIAIPGIKKWPGNNFSFHGWICLDYDPDAHMLESKELVRRQLYSFFTSNSTGFEAFFTLECILVIAVCTKKDYFVVEVLENPVADGLWHCLDIVHSTSRRPFTQSQLTVYIDGVQIHTSPLKFPSLSEPFVYCCIGSAGPKTNVLDKTIEGPSGSPTLPQSSSFPLSMPTQLKNSSSIPVVHIIPAGTQDDIWGSPISLKGQVGCVCVFHEALQPLQIKSMFTVGPNSYTLFRSEDSTEVTDLGLKLVLYYHPKACKDYLCYDLSTNHAYNGRLTGIRCTTSDFKDVINCIGGVEVQFPLLEQARNLTNTCSETNSYVSLHASRSPSEEIHDDWIIVSSSSYSGRLWVPKISIVPDEDANLEQNQVAGFLTLLRNTIRNKNINQEQLVHTHGMATVGALMQKVNASMIDVHVLMATQLLIEAVGTNNVALLHNIYQYVLFDFRIWSKSDFPVRIGHIQYLSTIIKDDRKYFRKKYGVQYMLDVIGIFYSFAHGLAADDAKAIRVSLLGLIKFFIIKEITFEELHQIISFMTVIKEESVMIEILDMLLSILENPNTRDQIFLLMFEPNCSELLYMFLLNKQFSVSLKGKLLKIISILLKSQKVYEKSKSRLRLQDVGYAGLISLIQGTDISMEMAMTMLDQVLMTDVSSSYQGALVVIQLLQFADIDIKIEAARKILTALFMKPGAPELMAKQLGWQDSITRLLIQQPITINSTAMELLPNPVTVNKVTSISSNIGLANPECSLTADLLECGLNNACHEDIPSSMDTNTPAEGNFGLETLNLDSPLQYINSKVFDDNDGFEIESMDYRSRSSSRTASIEDLSNSQSDSISIASTPTSNFTPIPIATPDIPNGSGTILDHLKTWEILTVDHVNDKEEELCQMVLNILFTVLWRGVYGSDKAVWKERGQVLTCINMLAMTNRLYKTHLELKRRLLEMCVQVVHKDLKDATQIHASYTENAVQVMRIVHDFVINERKEDSSKKLSEKLIEGVSALLDTLMVWEESPGEEWAEMAQMGLSILLVFVESNNLALCAIASAKLHTLLQTRGIQSPEEACYLLGTMDSILTKAVEANNLEHYSFVIPVIKALLEKTNEITVTKYLPNLPQTSTNPTFFEDFQQFALTAEWKHFIEHQMGPGMIRYKLAMLKTKQDEMNTFWNECYEATMVSVHKRNRETGESKLKFQSEIMGPYNLKQKTEINRFNNVVNQLRTQHISVMRQWRAVKMFLCGDRGAWFDRNRTPIYWKLSHHENFSRMRLKLVLNPNFDPHTDASRLRDNLGGTSRFSSEQVPLAVVKEAFVSEMQEDSLTEEDLNMLRATSTNDKNTEMTVMDKIVLSEDCQLITINDIIPGRLEVTSTNMCFYYASANKVEVDGQDFKWPLSLLREVHLRRYNLRRSALEFFLVDQTNYFLNFTTKMRNKVYSRILSLRPPNLSYYGTRSPAELLKASGLIQRWVNREISNFDYLMQLNTIAGRTYNDLSQYPVFPWILSDYTSEELDLNDPYVFRDLSKPIGVVNPKHAEAVKDKYESFEDPGGETVKFHYGTHYSNAAGVMHYMVRMEPFTSLHIQLQSGRFDVADRQFHSIPGTWKMLMDNPYDVKELIPEFFYLPEFLTNKNNFDLGRLQITKEQVNDVILPRWAKSAQDFIYQHRKALECEYVSAHLNEWIDLIFGYKQKGPAAVEALNVFYYCTYEGAVDLDAITDPVCRRATEGIINNFGQTPCQLLKEPHPRKISYEEAMLKAAKYEYRRLNIFQHLQQLKAFFVEVSSYGDSLVHLSVPRSQVRSFIQHGMPDTMVTISEKGILGIHGWLPYDKNISNYFTFEKDPTLANAKTRRKIGGPFQPGLPITSNLFVISHDAKLLFSGGHWDNSLRVYNLAKNKLVNVIIRHIDIVTCLALDYCGNHLVTGSKDTTVMIWQVTQQAGVSLCVVGRPLQVLCGHDSEVTCVAISTELDMAVSGSKDGTVNIYSVRKGYYMRTLRPDSEGLHCYINLISLSDEGQIVIYCQYKGNKKEEEKMWLHLYSINGDHLSQELLASPITDMLVTGDNLVTGNTFGQLTIRETFKLKVLNIMPLHVSIHSITVTNNSSINNSSRTHILAGLKDGKLIIVGVSNKLDSNK